MSHDSLDVQIIYVLTNSSMPGLVKIGKTSRSDIEFRMKELFSTGVPVPFECNYACRVENASVAEKKIHFAFGDVRVNPNREFFKIEPSRVVAILQLLQIEEVTKEVNNEISSEIDASDRASVESLKSRRPNLNFSELEIPVGSVLKFRSGPEEVRVIGDKKVEYQGKEYNLTAVTRKILGHPDGYAIQPSPFWSYNGQRLIDIYERFHSEDE